MFRLRQHVAQIITRETGVTVRVGQIGVVIPATTAGIPLVMLLDSDRVYSAITGEEQRSVDKFMTTRIVPLELP
jgi:hypothetical protein